ncbi:hypothetical protein G6F50_018567 [Rhizopus delemar]|uniref:Uncharacterized protein n=1 Tax=Rhizopus delemar TaxID=936053 RepID=A0A9P6XMT6_9FUNG|nr:hypothetical protein G6F50_018567 [Rhizopus delemar]
MRHGAVLAPVIAEIQQLVIQVFLRLAGQARVVAVGAGPALRPMTGRTGRDPGRHGVGAQGVWGGRLRQRGRCHKGNNSRGHHAENRPKPRQ